ncbi:hypothetical protein ABZ572_13135 [Streptomyces sp. NPDC018338]|uniref:hypothetical protein n=1 Tax=Streptomyces sp. NPDC018338 TaxID=3157192 RepID=UPI0033F69381
MSNELRRRLLLAKEGKEKQQIEQQLAAAGVSGRFQEYSPPCWVTEERSRFFLATTPAHFSTLPIAPEQLGQWVETIASRLGMGTSLIVGTGMEHFPWIRVETLTTGWGEVLIETLGRNLTLVSENDETLLVLFEEEHEYLAFTASGHGA